MASGDQYIGKALGGCLLEKLVGYGGLSAVFLAQQHSAARIVAVKVFLPRSRMDASQQRALYRRFLREGEVASQLHHPNILPVYSYGEQDGLLYIVMPYMQGGSLAAYIAQHGPLSLQETQRFLEQIASALDYAHEHGYVHCDVKPANILLDGDGRALLSDFGIARVTQSTGTIDMSIIDPPEYTSMGTPEYISPEQALGRPIDGRSDIYALGVVLFFMLTKTLPFHADSPIALALLHVHEPPPSLMPMRADVTPAIDHVVLKALAKQPEERFPTALALSSAFADAIAAHKEKSKEQWILEGKACYDTRQYHEALAAYQSALRFDPADELVCETVGRILVQLGRYEEALTMYDKLLRTSSSPSVYLFKGLVLQRMGRSREALTAFQKARESGYAG